MRYIKGIIFDFDGILVDSEKVNTSAAIKTFEDIGEPLDAAELTYIPGKSSVDFIPLFAEKRSIIDTKEQKKIYEQNKKNYNELWDKMAVVPSQIPEIIQSLSSKKKKLAIATTNRLEIVEKFFKRSGLNKMFSVVITGENVKHRKPYPETYLCAIEQLNLPSKKLLAVEDTVVGLSAAKNAGLRCAVLPSNYSKNDDFSRADFVIRSILDLLKIV
ncbi:MAG: hypothetical protein A3C80_03710 [Candidatus Ryanbacteria bacterium RIFCSPHIGHO2_02_FULL_45_43]|uniref:FCP1 homology domain-containing protein n=1 Tax=Candidatus Ryanbacteria bacterium RIFCSPHIGHO2_01_45_13 TaxID=1802112 RepID=A0A1G2FZH5_9BACT|nr:MAG: hypothetical protein A2718_02970 [Candidatus Ryanbacteria bacterium RIFCSPHIGHO2_01_FULL_44_130]OGZ43142.1 MAG: hypothetical protein A2W41_00405 [Candidatus Ryanbacteria bacterium RIFCSPHIGHO2_01_45_13]OGZ47783.1 MAG: hypothetical protein A3C80_03710 [Candidatus Ryanbacteria bacterium RIFCSPHIGHO2_02_FULL_45_43]OGZ49676.1 MAG: hypothetical protein A3E55_02165 [Candidatus Ryanbacteria bacterium RIFCSPHIGHO2_12_FULL_44_20]OGZ52169.1 MAG: hypothetical protein A3A17_03030 [Candidatus Ryanba